MGINIINIIVLIASQNGIIFATSHTYDSMIQLQQSQSPKQIPHSLSLWYLSAMHVN